METAIARLNKTMETRPKKLILENEKAFIKKIEHALKLIKKDEIIEALNHLKLTEGELEALANDGIPLEPELLITLLHNIGYCYQNTGELEEAASYIEASIFNCEKKYKSSKAKVKGDAYYSHRIKLSSYLSSMYAYLCVLMSCIENHYVAQIHARQALDYAISSIKNTVKAAVKGTAHSVSAQKLRQKIYLGDALKKHGKEKPHSNLSILSNCMKMAMSKEMASGLIKLNTIEGFKSELKESMNLNNAMKAKPVTYYKLKTLTNLDFELENDEVFKKVYNVIIALYLISTECSVMDEKEQAISIRNKAVAIARTFLPNDCSLISQIQYLEE